MRPLSGSSESDASLRLSLSTSMRSPASTPALDCKSADDLQFVIMKSTSSYGGDDMFRFSRSIDEHHDGMEQGAGASAEHVQVQVQ